MPQAATANHSEGALLELAPRIAEHALLKGRKLKALEQDILTAREFARGTIRPRALEIDRRMYERPDALAWDIVSEGAKAGLLNIITPRAAGGEVDYACLRAAVVVEEIAAGCAGFATLFGAHSLGVMPLIFGGPAFWDGAIKQAAKSVNDPRPELMAFCITEPTAGTDAEHHEWMRSAQIITHAEKVAGGYKLSGTKHFISNGSVATWLTVFMPLDPTRPAETLTGFLVKADSPGLTVASVEHKMGHRASPAAELHFDEVFVPEKNVIGVPGDGMVLTIGVLAGSRPPVCAIATGIARGAYERLTEWLASDDPAAAGLLEQQQVQQALARMWEDIHLSRQAYIDAATEFDMISIGKLQGMAAMRALAMLPAATRTNPLSQKQLSRPAARKMIVQTMSRLVGDRSLTRSLGFSSMAKAHGSDAAVRVTGEALEIAGLASGPLRAELEKCYRDAKLTQIYEGTNQLNRLEAYEGLVAEHTMELLERPSAA